MDGSDRLPKTEQTVTIPVLLIEEPTEKRDERDADERYAATGHELLHSLGLRTG